MTNAAEVLADINSGAYSPGGIVQDLDKPKRDPVNPSHYKDGWSDDAELIQISEHLTSNGGQALQYVARSTHIDTKLNKEQTVDGLVRDLDKAIWFLKREKRRLKARSEKSYASGGMISGPIYIKDYHPGDSGLIARAMNQYPGAFLGRGA